MSRLVGVSSSWRRTLVVVACAASISCAHASTTAVAPKAAPASDAPRAIAVYRAIAESIYVATTNRVVVVASTSLDSACMNTTCTPLAARWGVESLWWAKGDSSEARESRDDLLARAAARLDMSAVALGQSMLLEADPDDVPSVGADVSEWLRFRSTHADAAGAVRISPVGFSRSGRTAVAFVDWRCGPTCGHTVGVALTATTDTTWSVAQMLLVSSRGR